MISGLLIVCSKVQKLVQILDNFYFKFVIIMTIFSYMHLAPSYFRSLLNRETSVITGSGNFIRRVYAKVSNMFLSIVACMKDTLNQQVFQESYFMLREDYSILTIYLLTWLYRIIPLDTIRISISSYHNVYSKFRPANWHTDDEMTKAKSSFSFYDFARSILSSHVVLVSVAVVLVSWLPTMIYALRIALPACTVVFFMIKYSCSLSIINKIRLVFSVFELIYKCPRLQQLRMLAKLGTSSTLLTSVGLASLAVNFQFKFFVKPIIRNIKTSIAMPIKEVLTRRDPFSGQSEFAINKVHPAVTKLFKRCEVKTKKVPLSEKDEEYEEEFEEVEEDQPDLETLTVSLPSINIYQLETGEFYNGTLSYEQLDNGDQEMKDYELALEDLSHMVHDMLDTEMARSVQYYITRASNRFLVTDPKYSIALVMYSAMMVSKILKANIHFRMSPIPSTRSILNQ